MVTYREIETYAGVVEEYVSHNRFGYLKWHYSCSKCGQRMRFDAGECEIHCPSCETNHRIHSDGRAFKVERIQINSNLDRGTTAVTRQREHSNQSTQSSGGFFSRVSSAIKEANEDAHGKRLTEGLRSTGDSLKNLDERVRQLAFKKFLDKKALMEIEMINWSFEGRIKMGRMLQDKARKSYDFDQAESYALWLAGAWLESGCRQSDDAVFVYHALEGIAEELRRNSY